MVVVISNLQVLSVPTLFNSIKIRLSRSRHFKMLSGKSNYREFHLQMLVLSRHPVFFTR